MSTADDDGGRDASRPTLRVATLGHGFMGRARSRVWRVPRGASTRRSTPGGPSEARARLDLGP